MQDLCLIVNKTPYFIDIVKDLNKQLEDGNLESIALCYITKDGNVHYDRVANTLGEIYHLIGVLERIKQRLVEDSKEI